MLKYNYFGYAGIFLSTKKQKVAKQIIIILLRCQMIVNYLHSLIEKLVTVWLLYLIIFWFLTSF